MAWTGPRRPAQTPAAIAGFRRARRWSIPAGQLEEVEHRKRGAATGQFADDRQLGRGKSLQTLDQARQQVPKQGHAGGFAKPLNSSAKRQVEGEYLRDLFFTDERTPRIKNGWCRKI